MKWKIQISGVYGWYDLKHNDGSSDDYQVELFLLKEHAEEEARYLASQFSSFDEHSNWRVVEEYVPEEWSPYC